jgi:hypothetical protein
MAHRKDVETVNESLPRRDRRFSIRFISTYVEWEPSRVE